MHHSAPEGVVSLLLTPFDHTGAIDWPAYEAYVEWQAAQHPAGLFAVCGSSEMKWLAPDERVALAERAVRHAGAVPVVATANLDPDPARHCAEVERMAATGVAAVVLVPPAFSNDRERYRAYLFELAGAAPCPVLLYEWPQVPHHLLAPELFAELAAAGAIAGIKDTTCTIEGIAAKQQVAGAAVVYQANTPFMCEALALGVRGIMAVTSTARADLVVGLWHTFQRDSAEATALHRELVALDALLRMAYPATAKHLVALQGVRMPLSTRWPVQFTPEIARAIAVWQAGATA